MTEAAAATEDKVTLDLDALDRQDPPKPFIFKHNGITFQLLDPDGIDWQDLLAALRNPHLFFKHALGDDELRKKFLTAPMPSWKMRRLMTEYQEHFNLPDFPNVAGLLR